MTLRKRNILLVFSGVFFLLIHTQYFWERWFGVVMLLFLVIIPCFAAFGITLIWQLGMTIRERFTDKNRLIAVGVISFVLITTVLFPHGLISFSQFEPESVFIAQREGAANCITTLRLREDGSFIERNVCFGITETTGQYRIQEDTIFFENVKLGRNSGEFFEFAVIEPESKFGIELGDLVRFKDASDTTGVSLWITKNEMEQ